MTVTLPAKEKFIRNPGLLAAGVGVAVANSLAPLLHRSPGIKWMNDIYYHHHKCGGILVETLSDDQNQIQSFVMGIGINLYTHDFPQDISHRAGYLFDHQPLMSRNQLIAVIYTHLVSIYGSVSKDEILKRYQKMMIWQNQSVSFIMNRQKRFGVICGIDNKARLMVERRGRIYHLNYRDASQIRRV